jgi:hypothetical protein
MKPDYAHRRMHRDFGPKKETHEKRRTAARKGQRVLSDVEIAECR